jgi:hypothetical protein
MRVPQVNERVKEAPAHALRAMFAGIGQLLSVTDKLRGKSGQAPATAETTAEAAKVTAANGAEAAPEAAVTTEAVTAETPAPTVETPAPETTAEAAVVAPAETAVAAPAEAAVVAPAAEPGTVTPDATPAGGNVKLIPPEKAARQAAETAPASPETRAPAEAVAAEAVAAAAAEPAVSGAAVSGAAEPAAAEAPVPAEAPVTEVTSATDLPLANYDSLTVASLRARLRNLSVAQLNQLIGYEKAHAARADVIAMFERRIAKLGSES